MKKLLLISVIALTLIGCSSTPVFYVDQKYHSADYQDIKSVLVKRNVSITSEFQSNGNPVPSISGEVQSNAEKVFRESGIFSLTGMADISVRIVVNNVFDNAEALAKGFATGLTLGIAGSTVKDSYEITISMTVDNKKIASKLYSHAIYATIGNSKPPINTKQSSNAFAEVMQNVILNFIRDMQTANLLSRLEQVKATRS